MARRPPLDDPPSESEVSVPDPLSPGVLVASWLGGLCDRRVELEVVPFGAEIRIAGRTEEPSGCLLAGVSRAVELDFREVVDPAIVHFDQGP